MAPLSIFVVLGLAASALALPKTGHSGHVSHVHPTGTHVKSSGTGVRSHYLPSGTKASSGVRVHSHHLSHASIEPIEYSTVEITAKYNPSSESEACPTVTTKIQVTVTVTADDTTSFAAETSAAKTAPIVVSDFNSDFKSHFSSHFMSHHHVHASSEAAAVSSVAAVSYGPDATSSPVISAVLSGHTSAIESAVFTEQHTSTAPSSSVTSYADKAHTPVVSLPVFSIPAVSIPAIVPTTTTHTYLTASSAVATANAYGTGKRGLAYQTASLASPFVGSKEVSWAYNWDSSSYGLSSDFNYIPTLWSANHTHTDSWIENANSAIKAGSTHLFSFNEPELAKQANMNTTAAAKAYKDWIHDPFHNDTDVKLCAPSITNGYDPKNATLVGLEYLKSFMRECADCKIDCINIHWYGTEASDLKQHVEDTMAAFPEKEIWFTEFGLDSTPSSDTLSSFLGSVMPYLDQQKQIAGYAYFMLDPGVLSSGSTLNTAGKTYMSG